MSRVLTVSMLVVSSLYATAVCAATGETWDVTTKTSDAGRPGFSPETVMTLCLAPGAAKDPQQLITQDSNCEMKDIKTSGKKTTWKVLCGSGEDQMTGTGDVTYSSSSYQGTTKLVGKSGGEPVNMTVTYQGKRVGAACDTTAAPVVKGADGLNEIMGMAKSQMAAAMAESCEVANHQPVELISPKFFGPSAACVGKEKFACKVIAKAVVKDPASYAKLAKYEDTSDLDIAKTCKIDMPAATKAICAKVDENNYHDFADYCPEEVKAFTSGEGTTAKSGDGAGSSMLNNAIKLKGLLGF